jgi:hypothetical protein
METMMTNEFEVAFRQVLKSVVREVADEVIRELQNKQSSLQSKQHSAERAMLLHINETVKRRPSGGPKRASVADRRQRNSGRLEEKSSPFRLLLEEIGMDQDDLGPLTNGELRRIAQVDLPTFHGWMYLGRKMPEEALEKLRRHFRERQSRVFR